MSVNTPSPIYCREAIAILRQVASLASECHPHYVIMSINTDSTTPMHLCVCLVMVVVGIRSTHSRRQTSSNEQSFVASICTDPHTHITCRSIATRYETMQDAVPGTMGGITAIHTHRPLDMWRCSCPVAPVHS